MQCFECMKLFGLSKDVEGTGCKIIFCLINGMLKGELIPLVNELVFCLV